MGLRERFGLKRLVLGQKMRGPKPPHCIKVLFCFDYLSINFLVWESLPALSWTM